MVLGSAQYGWVWKSRVRVGQAVGLEPFLPQEALRPKPEMFGADFIASHSQHLGASQKTSWIISP